MESARRGAFETCRCWDKKDWPGDTTEEEQPPSRDSIANFWKFRLWGRRKTNLQCTLSVDNVVKRQDINHFTLLYHAVTISFSSYSLSLACSHWRYRGKNQTWLSLSFKEDTVCSYHEHLSTVNESKRFTSRLRICFSRSANWFLRAWISAVAGFSLGSSARITYEQEKEGRKDSPELKIPLLDSTSCFKKWQDWNRKKKK